MADEMRRDENVFLMGTHSFTPYPNPYQEKKSLNTTVPTKYPRTFGRNSEINES